MYKLILTAALIGVYLHVAYTDFTRWKIANLAVLALLACGIAAQASQGFARILPDLLTALLLFAVTFPFWLARVFGAGDVKLLAVTGFVAGADKAIPLVALILFFCVLLLVMLFCAKHVGLLPWALGRRVGEILEDRKIPYGVPISFAAIVVLSMQLVAV